MSLLKDINDCISIVENATKSTTKCAFKYLVVLDFEATCDSDRKFGPIEIIEWPAIVVDIEKKIIYNSPKEYFHVYIKPKMHPKLTSFCTELTGITQQMCDDGVYIEEALDLWNKWCYKNNLLPDTNDQSPKSCIVTCGDWDLQTCWTNQCKISSFNFSKNAMLFHSWINVKKVCAEMFNLDRIKGGMMGMLDLLNIKHEGRHHSGIDDVKNICNIVVELLKRNESMFQNYTQTYHTKKINFQRTIYDDIVYKQTMDKLRQTNDRNIDDDEKEEKEKCQKNTAAFISRPSTLPVCKVKLPWTKDNDGIDMNVVMFYHSNTDYFGAQFSNLFYSDITIDTASIIHVPDGGKTTLLMNIDSNNKYIKMKSAEHIFQCSKCVNIFDDLFMRELSCLDAAKCGQGRLHIRSNKIKKLYESFGGKCVQKGTGKKKRYWISDNGYFALREHWDDIKIQIMFYALKQKFLQNTHLIEEYLKGDFPIFFIEHVKSEGDALWADGGKNGNGTNWLGKLITMIAWMMRYKMDDFKNNDEFCVLDLLGEKFLKWMKTPNNQICSIYPTD